MESEVAAAAVVAALVGTTEMEAAEDWVVKEKAAEDF